MAVAPHAERTFLGKIDDNHQLPDLIEIQTKPFNEFLQWETLPEERKILGLQEVFLDVFPIVSPNGMIRLEFVSYSLTPPKYSVQECLDRALTYAASLKAILRLVHFEEIGTSNERREKMMVEQEVFLGELPVMTRTGTFIINGAERVIVSQLHKSPGVSFEKRIHTNGKELLSARIIPNRGEWLEIEYDVADNLWVTVNRKGKLLATTFLKCFGILDHEEILKIFYQMEIVRFARGQARINRKKIALENLERRFLGADVIDLETGEVLADAGEELTSAKIERIVASSVKEFPVISEKDLITDPAILLTLQQDMTTTEDEALHHFYSHSRPDDPTTPAQCRAHFQRTFLDPARYDLASVGRYKINRKLGLQVDPETKTLTVDDVVKTMHYLSRLRSGEGLLDDIDHLGNRRVRSIGELLYNEMRKGLTRMERTARDRMNYQHEENHTPQNLVNPKPINSAIKEFFGRSQLSHFMDQINPLAELTHKRRLSALGPGGLTRERAGFEVRDVHPTHYGRICPIETPEGPNIGLMASLATYAHINDYGYLETLYRKVDNGCVHSDQVEKLSAFDEENYTIAQANAPLDEKGNFTEDLILCRRQDDFPRVAPGEVDYMDISPKQMVSVAAALIPFLEHDDANRALMGSNMQRQAVPLLRSEAPLVGTGLEHVTACNSGTVVRAEREGVVEYADSETIRIRTKEKKVTNPFHSVEEVHNLKKYARSNQSTCINQRPIVKKGDKVFPGLIIADGPAVDHGELALGRNVLVGFMSWEGYNFEDAIILSEDLLKQDVFTSIHIEMHEMQARDTKLGPEEITRDIPNVSDDVLRHLDDDGIVRIGAKVGPGDILVGKVTPKGETELAPEEKLLRAIFGDKAEDVRDASLYVKPGTQGVVVDVKICSRRDKGADAQAKKALKKEETRLLQEFNQRIDEIKSTFEALVSKKMVGLQILEDVYDPLSDEMVFEKGKKIRPRYITTYDYALLARLKVEDKKVQKEFSRLVNLAAMEEAKLVAVRDAQIERLRKGDEMTAGVNKTVKVYVATKRRMSVGDKMAGRHGNKGVVAKILPAADMPFLPDGTPMQILLNPLGVPSRMNVGQLLETQLGWAMAALGMKAATPVFNGATETTIQEYLKTAELPTNGKIRLRDGRTGEHFHHDTTVGQIYMMKLNHLVDDKIHARAIGPYSLVTQQPLGGKAQSGGQRFGEMEVWALQAYGAAYTLQELLTIKSDDIQGRTKAYEAIVKGEHEIEPSTPESFNVLVREMQALCLDVVKQVKSESLSDQEDYTTED